MQKQVNNRGPFKVCMLCGTQWPERADFLADPAISIVGYQVHFEELVAGQVLFNHTCGTTLSIAVLALVDLCDGPLFRGRLTGGPDCPGYCLRDCELQPCPAACECAYVRDLLQILRDWPKSV